MSAAVFFQLLMACEAQSDSNILFKNALESIKKLSVWGNSVGDAVADNLYYGRTGAKTENVWHDGKCCFIMLPSQQFIFLSCSFSKFAIECERKPRNNKLSLIQYRKLLVLLFTFQSTLF